MQREEKAGRNESRLGPVVVVGEKEQDRLRTESAF